tara:strand:- start:3389 stop:3733 length:345 start_codon:yes stop_codon:yes gene_type:complete
VVKDAVIERDGGACVIALPCCEGVATTTDHRVNRGSGGSRVLNHPGNLIGACSLCNDAKAWASGEVKAELERRGVIVLPAATHEKSLERALATPVEFPDGSRWRLVDERVREAA